MHLSVLRMVCRVQQCSRIHLPSVGLRYGRYSGYFEIGRNLVIPLTSVSYVIVSTRAAVLRSPSIPAIRDHPPDMDRQLDHQEHLEAEVDGPIPLGLYPAGISSAGTNPHTRLPSGLQSHLAHPHRPNAAGGSVTGLVSQTAGSPDAGAPGSLCPAGRTTKRLHRA